MVYNQITMRNVLRLVGHSKGINNFRLGKELAVHPNLTSQFPYKNVNNTNGTGSILS